MPNYQNFIGIDEGKSIKYDHIVNSLEAIDCPSSFKNLYEIRTKFYTIEME